MRPNILSLGLCTSLLLLCLIAIPFAAAQEEGQPISLEPLVFKFLSAAIAFAAAAIGAGWAVGKAGAAGLAGSAERPEIRTTAIIITALGEAIAIYGIVIAILILGQAA